MRIEAYKYTAIKPLPQKSVVPFRHVNGIKTLKEINIGNACEGFIGKIRVRKGNNSDTFLNVYKKNLGSGYENYVVQNNKNDIIGSIILTVKKYTNFDTLEYKSDPSHVYIEELRNFSNHNTPYYQNIDYHKDIGTRLMQIALKRSYESGCNGNLKLISKNESKNWYKNIIGMTEEFPKISGNPFSFSIHNPNLLILPQEAKERLLTLRGGL